MHVAASLLSLDYMHNQVRAQGGAYGAGLIVSDLGYISSYSYRDPHLERTLRSTASWKLFVAIGQRNRSTDLRSGDYWFDV